MVMKSLGGIPEMNMQRIIGTRRRMDNIAQFYWGLKIRLGTGIDLKYQILNIEDFGLLWSRFVIFTTRQILYRAYHQIVTFCYFWEIFENCQLKTLLNSKILQIVTFFEIVTIWW